MRKKMLFISSYDSTKLEYNGVAKKLKLQIKTFEDFGYDLDYIEITEREVTLVSFEGEREFICNWQQTYHKTFVLMYRTLRKRKSAYDIVYFRYEHISLSMIRYFKHFKTSRNGLVIGELPTYMRNPYPESSFITKLNFYLKRCLDIVLPKSIDYLVTFSDHNKIFGVQTIQIENFFDVGGNKVKQYSNSSTINFLVLAQLTPAHGVDLILQGISNYVKGEGVKQNIFLNVVGGGAIKENLITLTNELGINNYVTFHGHLGGEKLDQIFDNSDVGFGALAIFRKGSTKLSELKIREYVARGLPFIYNALEPQIEGKDFCYKIDFEDRPVDMEKVVDFYLKLNRGEELTLSMRKFAEAEFTAQFQMSKVNNVIKSYYYDKVL